MYFTVYTHPTQRNAEHSLPFALNGGLKIKILNSSAKYWGGQIHYAPQPNYWRGHGPLPPPPIAPPMD